MVNFVSKATVPSRQETAGADQRPAQASVDEQSFELQGLWLRFVDPAVEDTFTRETFVQSLFVIRLYFLAGTALYICFGALDALVGGSAIQTVLAIRYLIVCPILVG